MKSFSDWVEKGYEMLLSKKDIGKEHFSWCFWAKGSSKEVLICGLVRDSSDSLGRPYPLFVVGIGPLKGWEDHWDLLPFACEKTWNQIEYLSAQMFNDISKFEVEIQNVRPPAPEWSEFKAKRENSLKFVISSDDNNLSQYIRDVKNRAVRLSKKIECFICLDDRPLLDKSILISYWYLHLKLHIKTIPNIIFMGGSLEKSYMALFKRPLAPADFVDLSSLSFSER
jgi:type VI secretion system protein VasJ